MTGAIHNGSAWEPRPPTQAYIVVPPSVYEAMQQQGLIEAEPLKQPIEWDNTPYFSTAAPSSESSMWSNVFDSEPLTRKGFRESTRSVMTLPWLLESLREETIENSIWSIKEKRRHPRKAILAALASTSCQLDEIVEVLQRKRATVEKFMQQLQRAETVGYDRRIGYYLRVTPSL